MNEERSFCYTLIIGVCVLICCLLLGKMALYKPTLQMPSSSDERKNNDMVSNDETIRFTDDELSEMIKSALGEASPFEKISVVLRNDNKIEVNGTLNTDKLKDIMGNNIIIRLLPKNSIAKATLKVQCKDGQVTFESVSANVAGMSLPDEMTKSLSQSLSDAVNHFLIEKDMAIQDIVITKQYVEFRR